LSAPLQHHLELGQPLHCLQALPMMLQLAVQSSSTLVLQTLVPHQAVL
jgi:hypothetical protein